jgi:hypothetical protein
MKLKSKLNNNDKVYKKEGKWYEYFFF